jgi:hypothetical protein
VPERPGVSGDVDAGHLEAYTIIIRSCLTSSIALWFRIRFVSESNPATSRYFIAIRRAASQSLAARHRVLIENCIQLRSPFALRAFIQSSICDSCQAPGWIGAGNKPALISSVMCALFQAMCLRLLSSPKLRIRKCFT